MSHLEFEEIVSFVTENRLNRETIILFKKVNEHIRKCESCRKTLRAVRVAYEEHLKHTDSDAPIELPVGQTSDEKLNRRLEELRESFGSELDY